MQQTHAALTSLTESTALSVADLHFLGVQLRATYLTPGSPSFISSISSDIADTQQIKVRAKAGGEGAVFFDSAIALLQGLFPPSPRNKITLANETVVVAPLGGYQYVSKGNYSGDGGARERSLDGELDKLSAFQKHIASFHGSDVFKTKAEEASSFLKNVQDYVFGRPTTLENIIHDFINTQLTYNQTYAYRLPPSYLDRARALADFHKDGVFSDAEANGIGNIAGRTLLHIILTSLERIASNDDPLQMMVTDIVKDHPELKAIPKFGAALAIELRRGSPPNMRDFLRFKFKNGTADLQDWRLLHVFGNTAEIPLTEFIYRAEGAAITSNKHTASVQLALASMVLFGIFFIAARLRARWARTRQYVRLPDDEIEPVQVREVPPMEKRRLV
ncbi:hypothetical protein B0H17DRAFT_1197222 [Mycena rosella]|uniref:Uncharacterized protein n=1 Tax=Mycena rosella TaxID=1033263 RepID=A0AAD7DU82_MYCRO|nr:hypothetical protein B0H17DRAFT_1197222 [Mycena rosella]